MKYVVIVWNEVRHFHAGKKKGIHLKVFIRVSPKSQTQRVCRIEYEGNIFQFSGYTGRKISSV